MEKECEHEWETIPDWGGDPEVIGGTYDASFMKCELCGTERELSESEQRDRLLGPPQFDD